MSGQGKYREMWVHFNKIFDSQNIAKMLTELYL